MLTIYLFSLVLGGGFLLLSTFGDFFDADVEGLDMDADVDAEAGDGYAAAKIFSIRMIIYVLFTFGAVGSIITWLKGGEDPATTAVWAGGGGVAAGALINALFGYLRRSDSGARLSEESFVGLPGSVRLPIGSNSPGQIVLQRGDRQYELRALPHSTAPEDMDSEAWDHVIIVEMHQGIARVVPSDDELYG